MVDASFEVCLWQVQQIISGSTTWLSAADELAADRLAADELAAAWVTSLFVVSKMGSKSASMAQEYKGQEPPLT